MTLDQLLLCFLVCTWCLIAHVAFEHPEHHIYQWLWNKDGE